MTQHNRAILEDWLESLHRSGKSTNTLAAYQRAIKHFVNWHERAYEGLPFQVEKILPRDIRDWKAQQQVSGQASPASVNLRLTALRQFFDWAQLEGLCSSNPCQSIALLALGRSRPKAIPAKSLRRLLRAAQSDLRDYAIIEVLLGTGIRVQELLALKLGDIVLGERSGKLIVRHGKGGQYREIPLTLDCRQALLAYINAEHPAKGQADSPLWFGKKGALSQRSSVMRLLQKYGEMAGIKDLHPHRLRHSFAHRYLTVNPDDLRGLARLLGHRNLNTVMLYTEPDMEDLVQRMERMELVVGDAE